VVSIQVCDYVAEICDCFLSSTLGAALEFHAFAGAMSCAVWFFEANRVKLSSFSLFSPDLSALRLPREIAWFFEFKMWLLLSLACLHSFCFSTPGAVVVHIEQVSEVMSLPKPFRRAFFFKTTFVCRFRLIFRVFFKRLSFVVSDRFSASQISVAWFFSEFRVS